MSIFGDIPTISEQDAWHTYKDNVETAAAKRAWANRALEVLPAEQFVVAKAAIDAAFDREEQRQKAQYNWIREQHGMGPL